MNETRESHTATLLSDGRVLVVGGTSDVSSGLATAEIYDPSTGIWTLTDNLITGRCRHTAASLRDGRVIVAGGRGEHLALLTSCEIFDPATGAWNPAASLFRPLDYHSGTSLADGRVLVVGGVGQRVVIGSAEVYDPRADSWSLAQAICPEPPNSERDSSAQQPSIGGRRLPRLGRPTRVADVFMPAQLVWSETLTLTRFETSTPPPCSKTGACLSPADPESLAQHCQVQNFLFMGAGLDSKHLTALFWPVGAWAGSQPLILKGEQSGLLTRMATVNAFHCARR